ncbi:MAG: hypothetical protein Unbinned1007contig1000_12 [Prokaryotic dsDNA virus sp.]|nr:MAG: hypothetical protein Unbinned1007contig1000_12 [Prokaryotic dsDNA virus sp.]|tara:strand:+ start:1357 stop:1533 length:177 start_codon:yes stop_codon:yes gene_type:complete
MYFTDEQLQAEMELKVEQHNKAVEIQTQCKQRIIEIKAILQDRAAQKEAQEKPEKKKS